MDANLIEIITVVRIRTQFLTASILDSKYSTIPHYSFSPVSPAGMKMAESTKLVILSGNVSRRTTLKMPSGEVVFGVELPAVTHTRFEASELH